MRIARELGDRDLRDTHAAAAAYHVDRRRDVRVLGMTLCLHEQTLGFLEPPLLKADERHAFDGTDVTRYEAQHHVPFVERRLQVALIGVNARELIVRIGIVRMALQSAGRDFTRQVELALTSQRLGQRQKDEARRIASQLVAPETDFVSHCRSSPWPSSGA